MADSIISFHKVTKSYGKARGITNVSLDVKPGEVFGFLGPNGAGKTTSISLMVDLIRPSKGKINIFGLDSQVDSVQIHEKIGFLMDDMALDKGLNGWQQLEYFGSLHGGMNRAYVRDLAKRLNCRLDVKFKNLSRGNRQKVSLISALMHDPDLLILDEPTSGLDPLIQVEFNKLVLERKTKGKTTFISSHILSEVQELCDRVAFIKDGQIVDVKDIDEIGKGAPSQVRLGSQDSSLKAKLSKLAGVTNLKSSGHSLSLTYSGDINKLTGLLGKAKLTHLIIQETDLETLFLQYYGDKNAK